MKRRLFLIACTSIALNLFDGSPARAWRTAGEAASLPTDQPVGWSAPALRYSLVRRYSPVGLSESGFLNAVGRAADTLRVEECGPTWHVSAGPPEAPVGGDGIVTVQVLRTAAWRAQGLDELVVATTDLLYEEGDSGWHIVDADILVNGQIRFGEPTPDGATTYDFEATMSHEFGHVLGLAHCCEPGGADGAPRCVDTPHCAGAMMFPIHRGASQRALSDDDRSGLCWLYPPVPCSGDGCPECTHDANCAAGMECVAEECRVTRPIESCEGDRDCPSGQRCFYERCVSSSIGDPCVLNEECTHGLCVDGACSQSCRDESTCPTGYTCDALGACSTTLGTVGDPCEHPRDCAAAVCVASSASPAICSRRCGDLQPCPADWACERVSGVPVCVPRASELSRSGCAAGRRAPANSPAALIALATLALLHRRARQ